MQLPCNTKAIMNVLSIPSISVLTKKVLPKKFKVIYCERTPEETSSILTFTLLYSFAMCITATHKNARKPYFYKLQISDVRVKKHTEVLIGIIHSQDTEDVLEYKLKEGSDFDFFLHAVKRTAELC